MLAKVIFAEEGMCVLRLFGTSKILMRLEMVKSGGELPAESTRDSSILRWSRGRTSASS